MCYLNKQKRVQYICIIQILCVVFCPSYLCWFFLCSDCYISKLPVSSPSMALSLCSLGDISNTKIAPCKLQWPAPYSSIYHIKMYCSTTVTFHSSNLNISFQVSCWLTMSVTTFHTIFLFYVWNCISKNCEKRISRFPVLFLGEDGQLTTT